MMLKELLIDSGALLEGKHWRRQRFHVNEVIVREGARCGNVFVLLEGRVQVTGTLILAARKIRPGYQVLEAGEVFGELALLDDGPHVASVVGVTDGIVAVIPLDVLRDWLENHPEAAVRFYRHLARILSGRLRRTNAKMLSVLGWGLKARGYESL